MSEQYRISREQDGDGGPERPASLIAPQRLEDMYKSLKFLEPEEDAEGRSKNWRELWREVKPWENGIELSDNIRESVRDYIAKRMPKVKESASALQDLPDEELLNALTHNWFEEVEGVRGERQEVLLAVMAHVVKRIEKRAYADILESADEAALAKIGLDAGTRELTASLLDASIKTDPLFIRFLAYSQLSGTPPDEASGTAFFVPGSDTPHTIAELFPHETQFMARRLQQIAEAGGAWTEKEGGEIFREYVRVLGDFYREKDPARAMGHHQKAYGLYEALMKTNFPVILTLPTEGYYQEPYFDPEMRISLLTPDSVAEEDLFRKAQGAMADSLNVLGEERFAEFMRAQPLHSGIAIGSYGVNLSFNAVAQEKPAILLYLNEQMRTCDRSFWQFVERIENAEEAFAGMDRSKKSGMIERMSRMNTMLHEFAHAIYHDDGAESARMGREPLTAIKEVKAETLYRPLVPAVIEKGGLDGTREQWAVAILASSLQILHSEPLGDPYYYSTVYTLNDLFAKGAVVFENDRLRIEDVNAFYDVQRRSGEELLGLYRDTGMSEQKATAWIRERCEPAPPVAALKEFLDKERE